MDTITTRRGHRAENRREIDSQRLKMKAALWDELMEFVEDKHFGLLMQSAEKEKNVSLLKVKKSLR